MHAFHAKFVMALAALSGAMACAAQTAGVPREAPPVPPALAVPDQQQVAARYSAAGVQIYRCRPVPQASAYAWTLVAPEASLHDELGAVAGRHSAGPTWEATDGSVITGTVLARVPAPDGGDIAWLLLRATTVHDGAALHRIAYVQRLNTHGGIAPATGCSAASVDAEVRVAYTADYWFYAPR